MLEQLSRHSLMDLKLTAKGDLHIDGHHTTEDSGIAIGEAVAKAFGERKGIVRYGHEYIPMDETLSRVAIDLSGRPYFIWKVEFSKPKLGEMDTELFREWFQAFAFASGMTLHVENLYGVNNHHIVESCYKGLARALRKAIEIDPRKADEIPSTKGTLGRKFMSVFGMKLYTVHIKSGETLADRKPQFIREGFNIWAFIFTLFWTLYHRLWLYSLLILAVNVVMAMATKWHMLDVSTGSIIQIAFNLLVGFHGNDWLREGLAKRGYVLADVTAADNLLRAEQRFFERSLATI